MGEARFRALSAAKGKALRIAHEIGEEFGQSLTREDYIRVARAFGSAIVPTLKPGRRPKAHVTAALADWKAGMRGRGSSERIYRDGRE